MAITKFTFQLIFLFLPGLIAFLIVEALTAHRRVPAIRIFLYSLVLGCLSYLSYYPLTLIPSLGLPFSFVKILTGSAAVPNAIEILSVCVWSIPLALVISLALNRGWVHGAAHWLKVSKQFANTDVWSLVMNEKGSEWVVVRDLEHDLIYEGWVVAFSDSTDDFDELFLTKVRVYRNSTGDQMYEMPSVYLSMKHGNKVVEFPSL